MASPSWLVDLFWAHLSRTGKKQRETAGWKELAMGQSTYLPFAGGQEMSRKGAGLVPLLFPVREGILPLKGSETGTVEQTVAGKSWERR